MRIFEVELPPMLCLRIAVEMRIRQIRQCRLRRSAPQRAAIGFRPASSASLRAAGSPRSQFPLAHPGLADGQGAASLHPPIKVERPAVRR
jgi:hypothetical protein